MLKTKIFTGILILCLYFSVSFAAEEKPISRAGKSLWSYDFLMLANTSTNDGGIGLGMQAEYFLTEHFSLAALLAFGGSTGSTAFIYTGKISYALFDSKIPVFPYIGYGVGRAEIGTNTQYPIPAYSAFAHYPLIGIKGTIWIFNSHMEVGFLNISENGNNKTGQLYDFAFGLYF